MSAATVTLVPSGVVTVTSTLPAGSGGEVAVICVAESTVKLAAAVEPKLTPVASVNPEPETVTVLAPAGSPATGLRTTGAAS